jgi:uncharacterized membrane protein YhhN
MSRYLRLELIYILISLLSLSFLITENNFGFLISKPLIVPVLLIYLLFKFKESQHRLIPTLMIATFFSILGDIFLLFTINESLFKIVGICTFTVAQAAYAYLYYLSFEDQKNKYIPVHQRWPEVISIGATIIATVLIYPSLGNFAAPAIIYALITIITIVFALNRRFYVSRKSFSLTIIGVLFFFISDALIGNDLFLKNIVNHFFIMLSYLIGHYLVIKGMLVQIEST